MLQSDYYNLLVELERRRCCAQITEIIRRAPAKDLSALSDDDLSELIEVVYRAAVRSDCFEREAESKRMDEWFKEGFDALRKASRTNRGLLPFNK